MGAKRRLNGTSQEGTYRQDDGQTDIATYRPGTQPGTPRDDQGQPWTARDTARDANNDNQGRPGPARQLTWLFLCQTAVGPPARDVATSRTQPVDRNMKNSW